MEIQCSIGKINVIGEFKTWSLTTQSQMEQEGVELIALHLESPCEAQPPKFQLRWSMKQLDIQARWTPLAGYVKSLPPEWAPLGKFTSDLSCSAPVALFMNQQGENRIGFAVSEALRQVTIMAGQEEMNSTITCGADFFNVPEAEMKSYDVKLRIDIRHIFYGDVIGDFQKWYEAMPEYKPAPVPEVALMPFYSTWYSFHQNLTAQEIEEEVRRAKDFGMDGVIVDDGWQTDDNQRGYGFTGDWEVSKNRIPDMKAHVDAVHKAGLKYMLWYGLPQVGLWSKACKKFEGKFLYYNETRHFYAFDPRFPEVREYLITIFETAIKEWGLDGFKVDFINNFKFIGEDPAVAQNYAGRDIKSLPLAVDKLLSDLMARLRAINPEILIEFRQSYIGPACRKYGNMFRVSDCPGDARTNRLCNMDLRLFSGNTAIHSDMIEWHEEDTAENAILQLLNIIFAVPQISVKLTKVPENHRQALRFWIAFWRKHQKTLLKSHLTPYHPEANYPLIKADNETEQIVAVYQEGLVAPVENKGRAAYIINGSHAKRMVLDLQVAAEKVVCYDTYGTIVSTQPLPQGLCSLDVPESGLVEIIG